MTTVDDIGTQVEWINRRMNRLRLLVGFGFELTQVDEREARELLGRLRFEERRLARATRGSRA